MDKVQGRPTCPICGSYTYTLVVKERQLGTKDVFTYNKCVNCEHTVISAVPADMKKYYPEKGYYSFRKTKRGILRSDAYKAFERLNLPRVVEILDYGCGGGQFLQELEQHGYRNVRGYDPYLPLEMWKPQIEMHEERLQMLTFDVITLNHSFEHLTDPVQTLTRLGRLMKPGGLLVLRLPVIDSYSFRKYGVHWVQFDAPRHINLFSRRSLKAAIGQSGTFRFMHMYDDSNHFQFTGSERYKRDQPLWGHSFIRRLFSLSTWRYLLKAKQLNKRSEGDQVVVVCRKINNQL